MARIRKIFVALGLLCGVAWAADAAEPINFQEGPRLDNPQPMVQAGFGLSVAVEGGRVLVGAPHAVHRRQETGTAYLFEGPSGRLVRTFVPPIPVGDDLFGMSVGWAGNLVVIGAPQSGGKAGPRNGAVYLFEAATGVLVKTIYSPIPGGEIFGHAVAGQGQWLVVGDPGASSGTHFHVGAAYVFEAKTGRLVHAFESPERQRGEADRFGHAVGFVGSSVAVAAPLGGESPVDSGMVYLFDPVSGILGQRLASPEPQTREFFGWSVAGDASGLIIGATGHRTQTRTGGAAYWFTEKGTLQKMLLPPTPLEAEGFGEAVGLMSHFALVAAPGRRRSGVGVGGIFVFDRSGGQFRVSIENPAAPAGVEDGFGISLSVDNNALVVGAPFSGKDQAVDAGVVHQFQAPQSQLPKKTLNRDEG